jgi:hypothetical protein
MSISTSAEAIVAHTRRINLTFPVVNRVAYNHMGALLADTILQTGLNYRHVVMPRVESIIREFPEAITTIRFLDILEAYGAPTVLRWNHPLKPRRLESLTRFLVDEGVYTIHGLGNWVVVPDHMSRLRELPGIGPKTLSYIQNLAGVEEVPIDRHVRRFVQSAGVTCDSYDEIGQLLKETAALLGVSCRSFDRAIWLHETGGRTVL